MRTSRMRSTSRKPKRAHPWPAIRPLDGIGPGGAVVDMPDAL